MNISADIQNHHSQLLIGPFSQRESLHRYEKGANERRNGKVRDEWTLDVSNSTVVKPRAAQQLVFTASLQPR